ncbi:MAG: esterase family protein [Bacteroidales bacterium]|nr:esterase family protein [Bacteroidales bacterium]
MKNMLVLLCLLSIFSACQKEGGKSDPKPVSDYRNFTSLADFNNTLNLLVAISDSAERETRLAHLWDSLKAHHQVPFAIGDSVALLYKGNVNSVSWAGDFNGWDPGTAGWAGQRLGTSTVFRLIKQFPADARLDYKIVAGNNWFLDPANTYQQYSGFGPNSELRMPSWIFPEETQPIENATKGSLSANQLITSSPQNLNYAVQYKVYLPYGYENLNNLPVIYITDGHEYADSRLGAAVIILDNLIFEHKISPVIAVFIDPRDPSNLGNNRRMSEYTANIRFADFVADELTAVIDQAYKTDSSASKRAIMGTSLGGWNAAFFGLRRSDKFGLIAIHSPAFDEAIISQYAASNVLPINIFMSTGVIYDTQTKARAMRDVLQAKGYPLQYIEVNQGHSWGNWRALTEEPLEQFFGTGN